MSITIQQNDTGRALKFPLSYSDGSHPNCAGMGSANFTLKLKSGNTVITCSGTNWFVQQNTDGSYSVPTYFPQASEVATAGTWAAQLTVQFPSGPVTWPTDNIIIQSTF